MRLELKRTRSLTAGFTLAEMAIVLVIVGLLLTSVLSTVATQIDLRNNAETQNRLNQIKEALIGYAQANGRLPCPANGTLATGATNAGAEAVTSGACTTGNQYAVLPWATLGVTETDVWGRRFGYKVTSYFANSIAYNTAANDWNCTSSVPPTPVPTPTLSSFALCSQGSFTITTRTAASKTGTSVTSVPVVILSYGKNGYGAYTSGGTQYVSPPAVNADETANAAAAATTFYSREQSPQTSSCSDTTANTPFCEFDDLVAYIPANVLVTKMVSAGKLP